MGEPGGRGGAAGRIALRELEHGWDGNDRGDRSLAGGLFGAGEQLFDDERRELLRLQRATAGREPPSVGRAHRPLEFERRVLWIFSITRLGGVPYDGLTIGADEDRGRQQHALVLEQDRSIVGIERDRRVRRAEIDSEINGRSHGSSRLRHRSV